MNKQEAWQMLAQVCEQFRGTLKEHQAIQAALAALKPEEAK
jgi:hypothetical protein